MNIPDMNDRQLLEHIAIEIRDLKTGQKGLNKKIDFVVTHTDEKFEKVDQRFDVAIKMMNQGFSNNDVEHAAMNQKISTLIGDVAEIKHDVKRLDEERVVMVERQNRFEKLHH